MLPYPFPGPFDYRVPQGMNPQPGDVVLVPLNRREEVGVVWDTATDGGVPDRKLKPVAGVIDTPPMRPALRQFVDWVAGYTLSPPGEVMAMALRIPAQGVGLTATGWRRADPLPGVRITDQRRHRRKISVENSSRVTLIRHTATIAQSHFGPDQSIADLLSAP